MKNVAIRFHKGILLAHEVTEVVMEMYKSGSDINNLRHRSILFKNNAGVYSLETLNVWSESAEFNDYLEHWAQDFISNTETNDGFELAVWRLQKTIFEHKDKDLHAGVFTFNPKSLFEVLLMHKLKS